MSLTIGEGLRVFWQFPRNFSTSCAQRNVARTGKFLSRLLAQPVERKIQSSYNARGAVKVLDKNRREVLNKLYMTNVCQVLSLGGFPKFHDKGIEITRVSVKDTSRVEVFWHADNQDPIELEMYLDSIAGKVSNQLMYGKINGNMPAIVFKRDMAALSSAQVAILLHKVSEEVQRYESISSEDNAADLQKLPTLEAAVPEMQMNVFNLSYSKILRKIKDAKTKSYPLRAPVSPSKEEFQESQINFREPPAVPIGIQHQRKKDLKNFILQYQKSALNSNSRKRILEEINFANAAEDGYQYEDELYEDEEDDIGNER